MGTFLTTPKMNAALAARVEASVRGQRGPTKARTGAVALGRLVAIVFVGIIAVVGSLRWQASAQQEDQARDRLLADIEARAAGFDASDHQLVSRVHSILASESASSGDVSTDLQSLDDLAFTLDMAAVYVRGERSRFGNERDMPKAVEASVKDAFVLCLLQPPAQKSERALLEKVAIAYSGQIEEQTDTVRRLHDAARGIPLLSRGFMKEVEDANSLAELSKLRERFERGQLARAKQAAKSDLLIYVFDDAPSDGADTEFDGSSRHEVTVGLVQIASGKPLLRMRTTVDPAWISERNRAEMSRGLTDCRLALDLRDHVANPGGPAR